jgi:hypothetical protein
MPKLIGHYRFLERLKNTIMLPTRHSLIRFVTAACCAYASYPHRIFPKPLLLRNATEDPNHSGYELQTHLGSGNFGQTFRCVRSDGSEWAIKVIPPEKGDAQDVLDEVSI